MPIKARFRVLEDMEVFVKVRTRPIGAYFHNLKFEVLALVGVQKDA